MTAFGAIHVSAAYSGDLMPRTTWLRCRQNRSSSKCTGDCARLAADTKHRLALSRLDVSPERKRREFENSLVCKRKYGISVPDQYMTVTRWQKSFIIIENFEDMCQYLHSSLPAFHTLDLKSHTSSNMQCRAVLCKAVFLSLAYDCTDGVPFSKSFFKVSMELLPDNAINSIMRKLKGNVIWKIWTSMRCMRRSSMQIDNSRREVMQAAHILQSKSAMRHRSKVMLPAVHDGCPRKKIWDYCRCVGKNLVKASEFERFLKETCT